MVDARATIVKKMPDQDYFLSELLGSRVMLKGKKIGKLTDLVIVDKGKLAEVTHLYVTRPFGNPALLVPWDRLIFMEVGEFVIDIDSLEKFTGSPEGHILLGDQILDKKVLDMEDREVEIVYDVKLIFRNGRLYVSEVDTSRLGLLRRIRLSWLARILYGPGDKFKEQEIPWTYVQPLPSDLGTFKGNIKLSVLKEKLSEIPPVDLADILEEVNPEQRLKLFNSLDTEHASDTLEEIDPAIQRSLISSLTREKVVQLINEMTPAQAADILSVLPMADAKLILESLNKENRRKIECILERHVETVRSYATQKFLKFPPDMLQHEALAQFPIAAKGKDVIMYLYITEPDDRLIGVVDLKELLMAGEDVPLKDIMVTMVISLMTTSTLKEAYEMFERYDLRAIPVTDDQSRIVGALPYRDVMNLKHQFIS